VYLKCVVNVRVVQIFVMNAIIIVLNACAKTFGALLSIVILSWCKGFNLENSDLNCILWNMYCPMLCCR